MLELRFQQRQAEQNTVVIRPNTMFFTKLFKLSILSKILYKFRVRYRL